MNIQAKSQSNNRPHTILQSLQNSLEEVKSIRENQQAKKTWKQFMQERANKNREDEPNVLRSYSD